MYDRAPRTLTRPADSTGHSVGPGSYEAPEYIHSKYGMSYHLISQPSAGLIYKFSLPCSVICASRSEETLRYKVVFKVERN